MTDSSDLRAAPDAGEDVAPAIPDDAAPAVQDDAAPAIPDDAAPAAAPVRARGPVLPWLIAAVAFVIAVAAVVVAVIAYQTASTLRADDAARTSAKEAGELVGLQITTIDGANIDQWVNQTKALAAGQFAEDLARGYDEPLREEFRRSGVRTVGEVIQSFVQSVDDDGAVVFVILRQTTARSGADETIEDELRMEVTLQRSDGEWLASNVAVLTPTPPLSTPPPQGDQ